jgi:hypothetical protein
MAFLTFGLFCRSGNGGSGRSRGRACVFLSFRDLDLEGVSKSGEFEVGSFTQLRLPTREMRQVGGLGFGLSAGAGFGEKGREERIVELLGVVIGTPFFVRAEVADVIGVGR